MVTAPAVILKVLINLAFYLNPIIGHSLQMLHLAWCLAVSAAATLCKTGSQTIDCGSSLIQSRKRAASISGLLFAYVRKVLHCQGEKRLYVLINNLTIIWSFDAFINFISYITYNFKNTIIRSLGHGYA